MTDINICCESCRTNDGCIGDPRDFGESPCSCHTPTENKDSGWEDLREETITYVKDIEYGDTRDNIEWREKVAEAFSNRLDALLHKTRIQERENGANIASQWYKDGIKDERERIAERVSGMRQELPKQNCLNLESHLMGSCFQCEKIKGHNVALDAVLEILSAKNATS
ncbi:MAG: hypothetical protein Q6360_13160 [Candidatus Brocadiales bacterium]|nr:hypothetical protein [Candidatus Brocadiales bacterium]